MKKRQDNIGQDNIDQDNIDFEAHARRLTFWPHLTNEEKAAVLSRLTLTHYEAGRVIRSSHTDCLGLIIVVSGLIRAHLLSPDGREITLYRVRTGEHCVLSASCILSAISFETQVVAQEACDVLVLPIDAFLALIKANIYVERDSYIMAAERFSDVVTGLERLAFLNLEQRLISFLLDESSSRATDTIPMTHEQIAVNIGSAREAVSRALKAVAAKGYVELFRGGVILKDKSALYKLIA